MSTRSTRRRSTLFEYHGAGERVIDRYLDGAYRHFSYDDEDDWTILEEYRFHQDSEIGASGYEAEYRLKDTDQWTVVPFEAGQTELTVKGLAAGEYEVRVRAFVDTTGAEKNFLIMDNNYGEYGDVMTVTVK